MTNLSGKYAIVGIGTSRFGKLQGVSAMGFTLEASKRAIEDAGLERDAIDGVLVMMPAVMGEQHGWSARVAAYLGIAPTFSATMDLGGATACGTAQTAIAAIEAGYCRTVLCCFATQNWPQGVAMQLFGSEFQVPYGDVGASGYESREELDAATDLKANIEAIRLIAGPMMNLGDVTDKTVPKMMLVAPPRDGGAVTVRSFIPHRAHASIGVLGAVSVATACLLEGSPAAEMAVIPGGSRKTVNPDLVAKIDAVVAQMRADGRLDAIRAKYLQ